MKRSIGKIVANGNSLHVAIPKPMAQELKWRLGTHVIVEQRDGCVVIAEVEYALRDRALTRIAQGLPANTAVTR